jgi:hypothetical protein
VRTTNAARLAAAVSELCVRQPLALLTMT